MKIKHILPSKKVLSNVISVSLLSCVVLGSITFVLKNPLGVLIAQTNPTSYWNVERDASNNLNFSFTNNGAAGVVGLQLLPTGVTNAAGAVNVGGTISANGQITAKQGIHTGVSGIDTGMTGARYYQFGYQEPGPWTSPFPDLILGYHTGIKMGANIGYGGIKFFADHPSVNTTQIFSVGDGDNNVRVANNLMFPNPGVGVISPINNASLMPNNSAYGAWRVSGSRNGWGGIEFDAPTTPASQVSLMVGHPNYTAAGIMAGMHNNTTGWLWYGLGRDFYTGTGGNMYSETFRDISNAGYFLDPAGTSNLNGATFATGPYINDWVRINNSNGIYWQQFGGGWHMADSTYIRSYGNKPILVPAIHDQDNAGYYLDPNATSNVNQINTNYIYTSVNGSFFPHPNGWNYIRGNSYIAGDTGAILANGNVGIGTTAPQGKLGVGFGNGDQVIFLQVNDDGLGIQTTLNGQPNNGYGGHTNNRLTLQPTTGVVGIHSTYPNADLHIKQSDNSQWGTGGIKLERSDTGGYGRIFEGGDQQLYLWTNSNSHYCIVTISASIGCASDGRLKKDIAPLNVDALTIIKQLKPSTFTWKQGGKHSTGFIAQDVKEILPEAVIENETDGYYALSDSYLTPYLVKSIQELDERTNLIEKQAEVTDSKVNKLTEQVTRQQEEIELLKREIEEIKKSLSH